MVSMGPHSAFLEPRLGLTYHLGALLGLSWVFLGPSCLPLFEPLLPAPLRALLGLLGALLSMRLIVLWLLPDCIQCYMFGNLDVRFWASGGLFPEL